MTTSLYKKLVAAMMLLFFLSYGASNAFAQSTFGGGNGTYADPYIISTTDHLDQLAADVNGSGDTRKASAASFLAITTASTMSRSLAMALISAFSVA